MWIRIRIKVPDPYGCRCRSKIRIHITGWGEGGPKAHLAGQDEFSQLGVVHPGESGGKRVAL